MKKTLSILLALVLLLSALPLTASAVTADIAGTGLSYNLWLGSTQVTDDNKDDIFGDGSASFSSSAFTLTLNDPEIPGVHTDSSGDDYKIYFSGLRRLIIKGSYMMSSAESKFGLGGSGMLSRTSSLTLNGDFSFIGNNTGISYFAGDLEITAGTVYAEGQQFGMCRMNKLSVGSAVTRVECRGAKALQTSDLNIDDSVVRIAPANCWLDENGNCVEDVDGYEEPVSDIIWLGENGMPAVDTLYDVNDLQLDIKPPKAGEKASYHAIVPPYEMYAVDEEWEDAYIRNGVTWYEMDTDGSPGDMLDPEEGVFEAGKTYWVNVSLIIREPFRGYYRFARNDRRITFNGDSQSFGDYGFDKDNNVSVNKQFTCGGAGGDAVAVEAVYLTIDPPVPGNNPSYSVSVPEGAGYEVDPYNGAEYNDGVSWWEFDSGFNFVGYLNPDQEFRAGYNYTAVVLIAAKQGYAFVNRNETPMYMNGMEAVANSQWDDTHGSVIRHIPMQGAAEVIGTVNVSIDTPADGANPSYTAAVPEGAHYHIDTSYYGNDVFSESNYYGGIRWWNDSEWRCMQPGTDKFEAGRLYRAFFCVKADPGYMFSEQTVACCNDAYHPDYMCSIVGDDVLLFSSSYMYCGDSLSCETVYAVNASDGPDEYVPMTQVREGVWELRVKNVDPSDPDYPYLLYFETDRGVMFCSDLFGTIELGVTYDAAGPMTSSTDYIRFELGELSDLTVRFDLSKLDVSDFTGATFSVTAVPAGTGVLGDIDGNGKADVVDATILQRYATGLKTGIPAAQIEAFGDVDGNGKADITDATFIQRHATNISTPYPIDTKI